MTIDVYLLELFFVLSLGTILYTYVGFPLLIYLQSRIHPHPWRQWPISPSVSVIVAVHNGASLLNRRIENLLALEYPSEKLDIIVISDGSSDGTEQLLTSYRHPRLKTIIQTEQLGKVAALNEGIQAASGEVLLFVDIRPRIDPGAVKLLVSNFSDPQVGCVTGNVRLIRTGEDPSMRAVTGLYWNIEQWIRNSEANVDSTIGVYGGFYAVRRQLVSVLPEGTILDDLMQCLSVIRKGYRCVSDERAFVYDTWPTKGRDEFNRKVRTLAGNFQLIQLAQWVLSAENRLRFEFISHKILRLTVPFLLLGMLFSSLGLAAHSAVFAAILGVQVTAYFLTAVAEVGRISLLKRALGPAAAFCMLNCAVIVGLYKFLSLRDQLWRMWTPTSVRAGEYGLSNAKERF